jgi:hypothetical protein
MLPLSLADLTRKVRKTNLRPYLKQDPISGPYGKGYDVGGFMVRVAAFIKRMYSSISCNVL